jgi:hypothetical protein
MLPPFAQGSHTAIPALSADFGDFSVFFSPPGPILTDTHPNNKYACFFAVKILARKKVIKQPAESRSTVCSRNLDYVHPSTPPSSSCFRPVNPIARHLHTSAGMKSCEINNIYRHSWDHVSASHWLKYPVSSSGPSYCFSHSDCTNQ